ncbi:MAG TPA: hypothetical protein VG319_14700 [Polyangia bacterium]|jgi:hypothetical protein|nr:hypothetical protein [Polyangia bacterium]
MTPREAREELFTAALDAFVETRARLAAALIAAGRQAEGQALKKVRRPTPSAWATNQVVRRARVEVNSFLEASARLRGSQGAIVAGRGDRGVYQADVEELRQATGALTAAARRIVGDLGRGDDRPVIERIVANARAAALTDAGQHALLEGALVVDLGGGADFFGGLLAGAPLPTSAAARPSEAPRPAPKPTAREEEARHRAQERARELEAARRDEAAARQTAAATEADAARTRASVEEARRRLDEAQEAARAAERALREAEAAQRGAQRDAAEAETRAGRATRRRESLEK